MEPDERAIKFHTLGNTLLAERKYNEAIANYKKSVEIEPEYASAWYHMAETYEAKNLEVEAEKAYFKAIQLNPKFAELHIQSGLDSLIYGPLGKAIGEYKKMKGIDGKSPLAAAIEVSQMEKAAGGERAAATVAKAPAAEPPGKPAEPAAPEPVRKPETEEPATEPSPPATAGAKPAVMELLPAGEMNSPAGTEDYIKVKLMTGDGKPVPGVTVDFKLRSGDEAKDAALFAPGAEETGKARKTVSVETGGDGIAAVKFKRSSGIAENIVYVSVVDMESARFCDRTVPAALDRVKVSPAFGGFLAGSDATVRFEPSDRYGNPVPNTEFDVVLAMNDGEWKKIDSFSIKTSRKGVDEKTLKLPERGGVPCRFEISEQDNKTTVNTDVAIAPNVPKKILFHPEGAKVAAGAGFLAAVRVEDRFGNPVPGNFTSMVVREQSGEEWKIGEPPVNMTDENGTIVFPITPPSQPGEKATMGVSGTNFQTAEDVTVKFETCAGGEAQSWSETPPWMTAGEAPAVAGTQEHDNVESASREDGLLAPLELRQDDEDGGISEMPDEITIGKEAATVTETPGGKGAPPAPEFESEEEVVKSAPATSGGSGSAFEGIDFDGGGSMFGPSHDAPKESVKPGEADAAPVSPPPKAGAGKSALDELGAMLSGDSEEGPAPAGPEPPDVAIPPVEEPAAGAEQEVPPAPEEAAAPAFDVPLPEVKAAHEAESGPEVRVVLEEERKTVPAGELVPIVVKLLDSEGNRLDGKEVALSIREVETAGMDSIFIQPSGEQGGKVFESVSDMTGTVMVNLQASRVAGKATVTVRCGSQTAAMEIDVAQPEPERIVLSPSDARVAAGSTVEVRAKVLDGGGNPLKGVACTFVLDESSDQDGELEIQLQSMTDSDGEVSVRYTAPARPGAVAVITASAGGVAPERVEPTRITTLQAGAGEVSERPPVEEPTVIPVPGFEEPDSEEPFAPALPVFEESTIDETAAPPTPEPMIEEPTMEEPAIEEPAFEEPAAEEPLPMAPPPMEGPAPPPPPPPPVEGEIEFLEEDLPHQTADLEHLRQTGAVTADEIAAELGEEFQEMAPPEEQDPFGVPKFHIDKGKKAIIEVEKVASKTINLVLIAAGIIALLVLSYLGYRKLSTSYHFMQGLKAFNAGQYDRAIPHFDKCANLSSDWPKPRAYLAQVHYEKAEEFKKQNNESAYIREITLSIGKLDEVIRLDPSDVDAIYARGQAYEFKGEFEKALRDYRKVLAVDPSYSGAKMKIETLENEEE
ncbi:MAG: tetratricopeptide repeat protein [bacterium]